MEDKVLTKDKKELTLKQQLTLLHKFPVYCDDKGFYQYDGDELEEYITTHTYKECSDEIGKLIEYWKKCKTNDFDREIDMQLGFGDFDRW